MNVYLKVIAGILIALILGIVLDKQGKDISILLTLAVCAMVMLAVTNYLQPIMDFMKRLQNIGQLDSDVLQILIKAVGIGLIAEITNLICVDAGNGALGKTLQVLASAVIIWMSIPVFNQLLELIENVGKGKVMEKKKKNLYQSPIRGIDKRKADN